ncbi:MAG: hypothetical protein H0T42_30445 [Deltaproteobacteria bacterium]|nr:hypothetical protein [Deltaproteobacteria bacterium]
MAFAFALAAVTSMSIGCTSHGSDQQPGGSDAPTGGVDARTPHGDAQSDGPTISFDAAPPDAPPLPVTMFPISGPTTSSPVIAGVTVTCHAQYSPRVVRVYVIVTDAQGATDRGTGSGTLELPDGTVVGMTFSEPPSSSQYDYRARFGTGANLSLTQYDQTCAAAQLRLSLTMTDKTGHVTVAPSLVLAPTVGGSL